MSTDSDPDAPLAEALSRALDAGQIAPWFQPVMDPAGVAMLSAEALPRWDDPLRGIVPAGVFIDIAIRRGLLARISAVLLDRSCANFAEWRARGIAPPVVSVNLTGAELRSETSVGQVRAAMARYRMAPGELAVEIAESVLHEPEWERNLDTVAALRALGVPFWLDDFGAGPCDMARIGRVDFALAKVDRQIVGALDTDPQMPARLAALVGAAQGAGMKIIAKGVETRAQIDLLVANRCDGQQGFAIARPMPEDSFAEWLDLNSWPDEIARSA